MRSFSPATASYFASRAGFIGHILVWFQARNRTSGAVETIGFWTGADHADFSIGAETRTYYAAGAMLGMDPIQRETGLKVRSQRISFSQVSAEVIQLVRTYDPRHAPVEVRRALFDPASEALVDTPHVILRGYVDSLKLPTPAKGESANITVEIATAGRALTRPLARYRSKATLLARAPADGFRRYASVADVGEVKWGD
ncbi:hypothetical protein [Paracoccus sp. (in: a-proteobacteria)]|uniref:hypothetical protein n=1 Tax=Paracoccus sp. TaxID=267 RepID=UPI0032202DD2